MKIFISYRREDAAGYNLMLAEQLSRHFGRQNIFMDIDSIKPGLDFRPVLQEAVGSCDALIALIGKNWTGSADAEGHRRLEAEEDWVRLEIATALDRRDILVIPALVHGAHMPRAEELPDQLRPLAYRNAIELSDARFQFDADRLAQALKSTEATHKPPRPAIWRGLFVPLAGIAKRLPRGRALLLRLAIALIALLIAGVAIKLLLGVLFPGPSPGAMPEMTMAGPGVGSAIIKDPLSDGARHSVPGSSLDPTHYTYGYIGGNFDVHVLDGAWLGSGHDKAVDVLAVPAAADLSVAIDARLVGQTAHRDVSLRCRVTNSAQYTAYALWVYPDTQTFILGRNDASGTAHTFVSKVSPFINKGIKWNRLQLSCIGDTLTAFINGHQVARAHDTAYPYGTLQTGTGTDASIPSIDARFANLEVTRPRTQVLLHDAASGHKQLLPLSSSTTYPQKYQGSAYLIGVFDSKFLSQHAYSVPFNSLGVQIDATMALDVELTSGTADAFVRLNCRRAESSDGNTVTDYGFAITPGTQSWTLTRQDTSGAIKTLASKSGVTAINGTGSNHVALSCMGNAILGRINGQIMVNKVDSTFKSGDVGLSVGDTGASSPGVVAEFRNIVVTKP